MSSVYPDDFNSILPNLYKDDLVSLCLEQISYVDNLRSTILSTLISVTAEAGTDYKTGFTTLVSSIQKLVEPDILHSWINNLTQLPKLVRGKGPAQTDTKIPTKLDPSQPAPSTSAFKLVRTDDDDKSLDAELESHSGHDSTTSFSNNRQYKQLILHQSHLIIPLFLQLKFLHILHISLQEYLSKSYLYSFCTIISSFNFTSKYTNT